MIGQTVGTTYVKPTRVGTYEVQCTELCGSGHGTMVFKNIHVLTQTALRQVARRRQGGCAKKATEQAKAKPRGSPSSTSAGCGGCHTFTAGQVRGKTGPSLDDLAPDFAAAKATGKTKATDLAGFVKESIVDPNAYIAKGYRAERHARTTSPPT